MEKQNLTQQKHTFTNRNKYTPTQHKHKTTKARFSHLLTHSTWKRRRPILILALHKFVTYLLRHPLFYSPEPTWDRVSMKSTYWFLRQVVHWITQRKNHVTA